MENNIEALMDAPIPGQSLTSEVGSRPWQQPPQYATVDEVVEHYIEMLGSDAFFDAVVNTLEAGITAMETAKIIQSNGIMTGKHTIDVGILVFPVIVEMIMLIGDTAKIDYEDGLEDKQLKKLHKSQLVQKVISEMKAEVSNTPESEGEDMDDDDEKEDEVMAEPASGFASRRV